MNPSHPPSPSRGFHGGWHYRTGMACLGGLVLWGLGGYHQQLHHGLAITNLSDQVPWGLYIANFLFLVGIAASAVILVAAVQLFDRQDLSPTLLPAKALAITAVIMSLMFVLADLGHPERIWHALPFLGNLNFPTSILAWDILVLSAYLLLNLGLVFHQAHSRKKKQIPKKKPAWIWSIIAILLGLSIHTVTAFMLAGNPSRPLWHSALMAPKFIVSAFAAGSALLILVARATNNTSTFPAPTTRFLLKVLTTSLLVHLFLLGSEIFTHLYQSPGHANATRLLYLGGNADYPWTTWIHTALSLCILATLLLIIPRTRANARFQIMACGFTLLGLWMEKGLGLVIPGLVPTPLGELAPYFPTLTELRISLAIWAFGAMILTWLLRWIIRITPLSTP